MKEFRLSFAALRVNANMTQEQAAEALGVSKRTLINWENGKVIPNSAALNMMAMVYNAPLDAFLVPQKST